jgi:hypothetical protein
LARFCGSADELGLDPDFLIGRRHRNITPVPASARHGCSEAIRELRRLWLASPAANAYHETERDFDRGEIMPGTLITMEGRR